MSYIWFFPLVLGLQFILFEHKHLAWFRKLMLKTKFTSFLSNCVFCRFCWVGAGTAVVFYGERSLLHIFGIGVSCGMLGLMFYVMFCPCLRVYERHHR